MLLDMVALLLVGLPRGDQVRGRPSVPEVPNVSSRNCTKKIFPSLILARSENGEVISTPDLRPRCANDRFGPLVRPGPRQVALELGIVFVEGNVRDVGGRDALDVCQVDRIGEEGLEDLSGRGRHGVSFRLITACRAPWWVESRRCVPAACATIWYSCEFHLPWLDRNQSDARAAEGSRLGARDARQDAARTSRPARGSGER